MGGSASTSTYKPIIDLAKKYNVPIPASVQPASSPAPREFAWQFPQYSQTWAFTPPDPSKFTLPPPFDAKKYGGSGSGSGSGPGSASSGGIPPDSRFYLRFPAGGGISWPDPRLKRP